MKNQWSDGMWMAIGITTGVVLGGILWIIFDKPSVLVVLGYPLGLVLGIFLKNRFGQSKKFGADLSPEQRNTIGDDCCDFHFGCGWDGDCFVPDKINHSRVMDRAFHCLK